MEYIEKLSKIFDWSSVGTELLVSLIIFLALQWAGFFKGLWTAIQVGWKINKYRQKLREKCSSLIVIGRKQGFSIKDVYVDLDVSASSLSSGKKEDSILAESYILIGGPGAGKSTHVKKLILNHLEARPVGVPFFVRLREYDGEDALEQHIVKTLEQFKFPKADIFVKGRITSDACLCVLDGLDEVRPQLLERVCSKINAFYHTYFEGHRSRRLVVTCRKEAYRNNPLDLTRIYEVRPLSDKQIERFAKKWPLKFPENKTADTFLGELNGVPQVKEITRSPLLLVGGLMQYTESNVGIPEQRIQYLNRITQWLVSDWATAQGHPPDQFRLTYEPLLAKLAFHMHSQELNECPHDRAIELFRGWLPKYGFTSDKAENLLESISTRTGILLRDTPGSIVFSQFGLQEFYASKISLEQMGPAKLAEMSSKPWWREVVLLAVAQESDPTGALKCLFKANPLMGAAAVAECGTPSLEMQQQASQTCVNGIDQNDSSAHAPTVLLLRKFRERQEELLCSDLENRLETNDEHLRNRVGRVLALAGTSKATKLLLKHPSLLRSCLEGVGYLSGTMEDMLIEWVVSGTDAEADIAIDLVCASVTADRELQLISLLPIIKKTRAEKLATALLKFFEAPDFAFMELKEQRIQNICVCAKYIDNSSVYFEYRKAKTEHKWQLIRNPSPIALLLAKENNQSKRPLWRILLNSMVWARYRGNFKLFLGLSLYGFALFVGKLGGATDLWPYFFSTALGIIAWGFIRPADFPPWMDGQLRGGDTVVGTFAFCTGFVLAYLGVSPDGYLIENVDPKVFLSLSSLLCVICSADGCSQGFNVLNMQCRRKFVLISLIFPLCAIAVYCLYLINKYLGLLVGLCVYFLVFSILLIVSYRLFRDWLTVRKVARDKGADLLWQV